MIRATASSFFSAHGLTTSRSSARKENSKMSEKEKSMIEKIAKLPPELQDKFADKLDGAAMALDVLEKRTANAENKV